MKSAWFSNRHRYEFAKCLQSADYSQHSWQLMQEFLQVALGAFRQSSLLTLGKPMDDAIEQSVIAAQKRVQDHAKFAECLGIVIMALDEDPHDFLGSTISELGQNDVRWKGQCFTPDPICQMMAEMTIGECRPDPENRLTFSEPACGGGAMVIATAEVLKANGFLPWDYYWTCVDVDWRMFAICYIQLTLLGIPAGVIHGNTLSLEQHDSAVTFAGALHPLRKQNNVGMTTIEAPKVSDLEDNRGITERLMGTGAPIKPPKSVPKLAPKQSGQLSLFDAMEAERN